jgi:hypothetical protein
MPERQIQRDGDVLSVSGSSRRLAGPTDLARLVDPDRRARAEAAFKAEEPDKSLPERIYYPDLERPALIVYPLLSSEGTSGADDYLVALKVAIPGDPTKPRNNEGDVTYLINTVAQRNWLPEFKNDDEDEDVDD